MIDKMLRVFAGQESPRPIRYEDTDEYRDRVTVMYREMGLEDGDALDLVLLNLHDRLKALEGRR